MSHAIRAVIVICLASAATAAPPAAKVLIEFGWDEPDTSFLRNHPEALDRSPFDGCVFHAAAKVAEDQVENFAWKFWGDRAYTETELAGAFEDLKGAPPSRFRHNLLRVNTAPAAIDWFDDFGPIRNNAALAAKLAKEGKARGVLFDVEQYEGQLFHYAKQRDAGAKSWEDYSAQAKKRGGEVMTAFQDGFPGLTVLLTFGPSLVERHARRRLRRTEGNRLRPARTLSRRDGRGGRGGRATDRRSRNFLRVSRPFPVR